MGLNWIKYFVHCPSPGITDLICLSSVSFAHFDSAIFFYVALALLNYMEDIGGQ